MKSKSLAIVAGVAVIAGVGFVLNPLKSAPRQGLRAPSTDMKIVRQAAKTPTPFIVKNEKSKDVKVQTQVTRARMNLAY
jgi:hypothetical protein